MEHDFTVKRKEKDPQKNNCQCIYMICITKYPSVSLLDDIPQGRSMQGISLKQHSTV